MARKPRQAPPKLDTIWEVPDPLWARILPLIEQQFPRKKTGRPPADLRLVLNGIIFRLRSGCQWSQLPRSFGPKSTVHDWFQRWNEAGFFAKLMAVLITECDDLRDVNWKWQAADGSMGKARFGGTKSVPTPPIGPKTGPNVV